MRVDQPQLQLTMPAQLLPAAHHTWLESCKNVRISALHRDVARVLTEHGIPHNIEHVTEDELFSVDIALPGESSCSARIRNFARLAFATNCIIKYFTGIRACARAFIDVCSPGWVLLHTTTQLQGLPVASFIITNSVVVSACMSETAQRLGTWCVERVEWSLRASA